ncbi:MAG: tetratricopeptide repeat protein [Planctomycetota bacterium]|jgi:hypothetical protein
MMRTTALTILLAAATAFAGDSEAEKQYRDAWWRESSQADINKALEAYLRAAAADGPEAVRAKALLKAADCYKRLGKPEEALRTLEELRSKFPAQKEVLATAAQRAKEWTAIDLRKSYSDWYRRYLFSPEFQQQVVDKVLNLPMDGDAANWLLSLGDAAVPALQEAVKSKNEELVASAMDLLLKLEAIPPARVLLDNPSWAEKEFAWQAILRAPDAARLTLRGEIDNPATVAVLLKASATSTGALIQAMAGDAGGKVAVEKPKVASAILGALHNTRDPKIHAALADLGVHPKSPAPLRPIAAGLIARGGWIGASATDWLEWSRDAEHWDMRTVGVEQAGSSLGLEDGEAIDAILGDIEDVGKVRDELRGQLGDAFAKGLLKNGRVLQLSWSPERLQRYLKVGLHYDYDDAPIDFLRKLRSNRTRGSNVVEAILLDPVRFAPAEDGELGMFEYVILFEHNQPDEAFAAARWAGWAKRVFLRKWESWDDKQKIAALDLALRGLAGGAKHQRELGKALTEMIKGKQVTDGARERIKELSEREDDC